MIRVARDIAAGSLAYVGPGPGLSMLWALIGLLGTVAFAVGAVALWPLRSLWRRLRRGKDDSARHGGNAP